MSFIERKQSQIFLLEYSLFNGSLYEMETWC